MNFGPLSGDGGERRLNVAITRARYNVKLVGSIQSEDINLNNIITEGLKMLRSYIEFTQQGIKALQNQVSFNNVINTESPFEEAVYDFLSAKGYEVATQVGCSVYRIDMAVKYPAEQSNKFIIGIECDGATYHSSRTARERDRLRQEVLESNGWTIYRIWSTNWIRNTKTEKTNLINAIEKEIKSVAEQTSKETDRLINAQEEEIISAIEETSKENKPINGNITTPATGSNKKTIRDKKEISIKKNKKKLNPKKDIADKQLTKTSKKIIEDSGSIARKRLFTETAKELGYKRISEKITNSLSEILEKLIKNNEVIEKGQKICIPNKKDNTLF